MLSRRCGGAGDIVSPQVNKDHTVTFRIHAPKASKVEVEGDFLPDAQVRNSVRSDGRTG